MQNTHGAIRLIEILRNRFSHNFDSVHEIVAKKQEEGHNFWRNKTDNKGRPSSPMELLVSGSFRLLTRNVTLDDLREQTFISSDVHRCFFTKFMSWYDTVVFPLFVRLPTLDELFENGADYRVSGFPGSVLLIMSMFASGVHQQTWSKSLQGKKVSFTCILSSC